ERPQCAAALGVGPAETARRGQEAPAVNDSSANSDPTRRWKEPCPAEEAERRRDLASMQAFLGLTQESGGPSGGSEPTLEATGAAATAVEPCCRVPGYEVLREL